MDDTFRKLLLESQGYRVEAAAAAAASTLVEREHFQLALLATKGDAKETLELCVKLKRQDPRMRVAIIAQRTEYVPASECVDAVIREQHSPGRFLAAVKKLVDGEPKELFMVTEGE